MNNEIEIFIFKEDIMNKLNCSAYVAVKIMKSCRYCFKVGKRYAVTESDFMQTMRENRTVKEMESDNAIIQN